MTFFGKKKKKIRTESQSKKEGVTRDARLKPLNFQYPSESCKRDAANWTSFANTGAGKKILTFLDNDLFLSYYTFQEWRQDKNFWVNHFSACLEVRPMILHRVSTFLAIHSDKPFYERSKTCIIIVDENEPQLLESISNGG